MFSEQRSSMVIADFQSKLRRRDVVILLMVNDCHGAGLMANSQSG